MGHLQVSGAPVGQWATCRTLGHLQDIGAPEGQWGTCRSLGHLQVHEEFWKIETRIFRHHTGAAKALKTWRVTLNEGVNLVGRRL